MYRTFQSNRFARRAAWFASGIAAGTILVPAAIATPQAGSAPPANAAASATSKYVSLQTAVDGAKIVQATVVQRTPDKEGKLTDKARLRVTIAASGMVRIERQMPDAEAQKQTSVLVTPTLAVFNGKETFEYDPESHKYFRFAASPEGTPISYSIPIRPLWLAVRGYSEKAPEAASEETVAGRKMVVRNADYGQPGASHPTLRQRYLIDAETRLLRRVETILWQGDTSRVIMQYEFSDWVLDATLPGDYFTWQPPADAKETSPRAARPSVPSTPAPPSLALGTTAPDFTCIGEDGKPIKLSDLKGKVVVLDFWATWCLPCLASMPHLQSVYEKVKDNKDVVVLALCISDERAAYDRWLSKNKATYTFPTAYDPAGRDSAKNIGVTLYKAKMIPAQYVIDRDGKVAAVFSGVQGKDDHRLEEELNKLGVSIPAEKASATP